MSGVEGIRGAGRGELFLFLSQRSYSSRYNPNKRRPPLAHVSPPYNAYALYPRLFRRPRAFSNLRPLDLT